MKKLRALSRSSTWPRPDVSYIECRVTPCDPGRLYTPAAADCLTMPLLGMPNIGLRSACALLVDHIGLEERDVNIMQVHAYTPSELDAVQPCGGAGLRTKPRDKGVHLQHVINNNMSYKHSFCARKENNLPATNRSTSSTHA